MKHFWKELTATIGVFVALELIAPLGSQPGFWRGVVYHAGEFALASAIPIVVLVVKHRAFLAKILTAVSRIRSAGGDPVLSMFEMEVKRVGVECESVVLHPSHLDEDALASLAVACFRERPPMYIGTDMTKPSEFFRRYAKYLEAHEMYADAEDTSSVRVLVGSQEGWRRDYADHPDTFRTFVEWHLERGFELLCVSYDEALALAIANGMSHPEVAFWKKVGALILSVTMPIPGMGAPAPEMLYVPTRDSRYHSVTRFLGNLIDKTSHLRILDGRLTFERLHQDESANLLSELE